MSRLIHPLTLRRGYRCNRGERVNDFPGNRDCRQQDKDDDRDERYEQGRDRDEQSKDQRDRDGRFDDRFNRSLIVEHIANQDLPRELQGDEVFSVIEQNRYSREPQMIVLREKRRDPQISQRQNSSDWPDLQQRGARI